MSKTTPTQKAIDLIVQYGGIDGSHHKQWVLSEVLKTLMGLAAYKKFLKEEAEGEYGEWDEGSAP